MVFTEGQSSEPDYIKGLKKLAIVQKNVALKVELCPDHGVPLTLVELAVGRARDGEVDECWCLFDVEWPQNHPNLDAALSLARDNGIRVAVSNPCFEIWLILHYKHWSAFKTTDEAESLSRRIDGRSGKSIDPCRYMDRRKTASQRAKSLAERHIGNGTSFPHDNPSSGMYLFLETLEPGISNPDPRETATDSGVTSKRARRKRTGQSRTAS